MAGSAAIERMSDRQKVTCPLDAICNATIMRASEDAPG